MTSQVTDASAATTAGSIVRGGLWGTAGGLLPQLFTLVLSVVAARILGPEEFGRQSFIAFIELSVIMLLTGGLPVALMRYYGEFLGARNPAAVRSLVVRAWLIEAAAAVAGAAILIGAGLLGAKPEGAWILAGIAATMGILHTVPSALLLGAQRWRAATIVGLATGALGTVAAVVVLAAGGGITGLFAVEAAVSTVNLVWSSLLARRTLEEVAPAHAPGPPISYRAVWNYAAVSTIWVGLTFVVWRRSELLFLQHYSSETQIGLFSIAFAAVSALAKLPDAIGNVAIAATATLYGAGDEERIRTGYSRGFRLLLVLTLPITAAVLVLGPETLRLVYGEEYEATGRIFLILAAPFPLIPMMTLATAVLYGLGRVRAPLVTTAVAAVVNVALAFALIPSYDALGAAFASAGAHTVGCVLALVYLRRAIGGIDWDPASALHVAIAAVIAAAAAWLGLLVLDSWAGVILALVAGTLSFVALARFLRVMTAADTAWLDAAAGHRLGGWVGRAVRLFGVPPERTAA